jgi:hypothetical protein
MNESLLNSKQDFAFFLLCVEIGVGYFLEAEERIDLLQDLSGDCVSLDSGNHERLIIDAGDIVVSSLQTAVIRNGPIDILSTVLLH